MKKSALSYCTIMVNMRSTLAEHGEDVAGRYMLLCLYCAEQVNTGVIEDCGEWTSRQWMIRVGINDRPEDIPGIWHWDGNNLVVDAYNAEGEEKALARRKKGKEAADARWGINRGNDESNAPCSAECNTESNAHSNTTGIASCNTHDAVGYAPSIAASTPSSITQSNAESNAENNAKKRKEKERKEFSLSFPCEVDEVVSHLRNEVQRGRLVCPIDRLAHFSGLFLSDFRGRGWCFKDGMPVKDWKEAARSFAARCGDNERGFSGGGTSRGQGISNNSNANRNEYDV